MASTKITITIPNAQLAEVRKRVAAKESKSISGFVQEAVRKSLDSTAEFRELVAQALSETGGPVTPKERAWARKMLTPQKRGEKPSRHRRAA